MSHPAPSTRLFGALVACLIATAAAAQPWTDNTQPDPTGEWLVAEKLARIKIVDCGGQMWGVVAWESTPGGVDRKNPDPNLRTRPTLGMPILLGMARSKVNQWDGQIYNSEDGHTYSASISLLNQTTLRVQGCFLGFLCGGENWTRFEPQDIPDNTPARVTPPPPTNRKTVTTNKKPTANSPIEASDDVCLRLFGPTRLPHQGGLK